MTELKTSVNAPDFLTKWDGIGERIYSYGVSQGMLYLDNRTLGVPWNGLVNVQTSRQNQGIESYYQNGSKVSAFVNPGDFIAKISAFTYPSEFESYQNVAVNPSIPGLYYDMQVTQPAAPFGLSYKTRLGSDTDLEAYQIHLIYNCYVTTHDKDAKTTSSNTDPNLFGWDVSTVPRSISSTGSVITPTPHLIIDSRYFTSLQMNQLETILYGDSETSVPARLPTPEEIVTILS